MHYITGYGHLMVFRYRATHLASSRVSIYRPHMHDTHKQCTIIWPMKYARGLIFRASTTGKYTGIQFFHQCEIWCHIMWRHQTQKVTYTHSADFNSFKPRQNGRHFPDDIFKCIFLTKMDKFWLRCHWSLFPMVQLTLFQHWFDYGLALIRRQAIILTNDGWFTGIYASLGFNELKLQCLYESLPLNC